MSFLRRNVDEINRSDLQVLIDDQVPEGRSIEYKMELPGNSDGEKKEFLADVSSFSNAAGGHLIFGIKESNGLPEAIAGLEIEDPDATILRIENMIRDGIEPRITGIKVHIVKLDSDKFAIIVQIPRSWASPHMVTHKGHSKFYSRNSAGKYPLDVTELRSAFALSESITVRIEGFRRERLGKIVSGNTPVILAENPKIILHIIPFAAFDPASQISVASVSNETKYLGPMGVNGWDHRYNFDGFLTFSEREGISKSYVQLFRNGIIEAVQSSLLADYDGRKLISSVAYESVILSSIPNYVSVQRKAGIELPLIVLLSMVGVKGYHMSVNQSRFHCDDVYPIDQDVLLCPDVLVEDFDFNASAVLRPVFDAVWNAAGWPRSMNYDKDGRWVGN